MPSIVLIFVSGLAAVYVLLLLLLLASQHPQEPPVVLGHVPFLGPIIALIQKRWRLFISIR